MSKRQSVKSFFFCAMVFLGCASLSASESETPNDLEQQIKGLWLYTDLITSDGKQLPLNGIFLLNDGVFVQYAEFKGEPIKDQGAMAHAGSYSLSDEFVHLVAEQTISTAPLENPPLTSQGQTEHDLAVSRTGQELTLVFSKGTGTVQIFELAGSGSGEVYKLKNGALAFVNGYFILVDGNENGVNTGYGTYEKDNNAIKLNIIRWTTADPSSATNLYDISMNATFDGKSLNLEDGRRFQVIP
jgi:hypothetical protein